MDTLAIDKATQALQAEMKRRLFTCGIVYVDKHGDYGYQAVNELKYAWSLVPHGSKLVRTVEANLDWQLRYDNWKVVDTDTKASMNTTLDQLTDADPLRIAAIRALVNNDDIA